jgi:hypothetical protein
MNQLAFLYDPTGEKIREGHALGPLGSRILRFCAQRVGREFTGQELCMYVWHTLPGVAPDSPRRVLSLLRQKGEVDYQCTDRLASRYKVLGVRLGERVIGEIREEML